LNRTINRFYNGKGKASDELRVITMAYSKLLEETERLTDYLNEINNQFEKVKSAGNHPDFYTEVQPFANEVHAFVEQWLKEAVNWLNREQVNHLYPFQLQATAENIKEIAVQCFYPETSYSRFKHTVKSVHYVLEKVLEGLKKGS